MMHNVAQDDDHIESGSYPHLYMYQPKVSAIIQLTLDTIFVGHVPCVQHEQAACACNEHFRHEARARFAQHDCKLHANIAQLHIHCNFMSRYMYIYVCMHVYLLVVA